MSQKTAVTAVEIRVHRMELVVTPLVYLVATMTLKCAQSVRSSLLAVRHMKNVLSLARITHSK